jgi:uncharacterized membrane protein
MNKTRGILYNVAFSFNCLLLFLVLLGKSLAIPTWLQVVGRMHPLVLHFPIVLLVFAVIYEYFLSKKDENTEGGYKREIGDWILLSAAFTAGITALMGLFLSQEQGYNVDAIAWHKWTGVAVSIISILWYAFRNTVRETKHLSLLASGASLLAIIMAGHQGANITHGAGFLTAPFNPKNEIVQVKMEDAVVFKDMVKPILEKKCLSCHNNQKSKGELVMETQEQILKGGKNGKLWDVSSADLGLLMQRIHLPLEEKKHMPPIGKPQLSDEEKAILHHWLKNGADFNKKIKDLADSDTLKIIANNALKTSETEHYNFQAADENTVKKLSNNYRLVYPLALNSPALGVEFFGPSFFFSEQLKELEAVKDQIVHLSLNKMPVKDADIKTIAAFTALRKLNLSFTQITGASLGELKNLKELRQLSLSGTGVKLADLEVLKNMPKLSALFLWNTGLSESDKTALKSTLPHTFIDSGFQGDTVVAKLSAPILVEEDTKVFQNDTKVHLKHYVKGAIIRYTLDGTNPDSLKSPIYDNGILIDKTTVLKAKAFLPNWVSSDTFTQQLYKVGFIADSVRLVQAPNPKYSGTGKSLFDTKLGETAFQNGKWLGFKETFFECYLYFNKPIPLSKITFNSLIDINSYIMPVQQLEVWGGTSTANLSLLKTLNPTQPTKIMLPYIQSYECPVKTQEVTVVKLIGKSVQKLPTWHPGKGDKGWFFVDEVFLN